MQGMAILPKFMNETASFARQCSRDDDDAQFKTDLCIEPRRFTSELGRVDRYADANDPAERISLVTTREHIFEKRSARAGASARCKTPIACLRTCTTSQRSNRFSHLARRREIGFRRYWPAQDQSHARYEGVDGVSGSDQA
jgi:hypothetical protein